MAAALGNSIALAVWFAGSARVESIAGHRIDAADIPVGIVVLVTLLAVATTTVAAMMLTACGSGSTGSTTNPSASGTAGNAGKTVTFWVVGGDTPQELRTYLQNTFKAKTGADAQVQTNLQILTHLIDFDLDPQEAVEAPRWRSHQPGGEADWPHTISDSLLVEDRLAVDVRDELARRGHRLEVVGPLDGGCNAQVILRQPDGMLLAAADPRRDGYALAF